MKWILGYIQNMQKITVEGKKIQRKFSHGCFAKVYLLDFYMNSLNEAKKS